MEILISLPPVLKVDVGLLLFATTSRGNVRKYVSSYDDCVTGATGHVVMDNNGDRHPYYWVWDLRPGDETFHLWTEIRMTDPPGRVSVR